MHFIVLWSSFHFNGIENVDLRYTSIASRLSSNEEYFTEQGPSVLGWGKEWQKRQVELTICISIDDRCCHL